MDATYTTRRGDTWDLIAYQVYGSEQYAGFLMQHNFPLLDILIFDAGTVLNTPALPETAQSSGNVLPAWRTR